jgi:hypothetical protein
MTYLRRLGLGKVHGQSDQLACLPHLMSVPIIVNRPSSDGDLYRLRDEFVPRGPMPEPFFGF